MPKIKIKGWIEDEEELYTNIPKKCPKCSSELMRTDALRTCGLYWVGCKNLRCRWSEVYTE